jgi:hypothetical protein
VASIMIFGGLALFGRGPNIVKFERLFCVIFASFSFFLALGPLYIH